MSIALNRLPHSGLMEATGVRGLYSTKATTVNLRAPVTTLLITTMLGAEATLSPDRVEITDSTLNLMTLLSSTSAPQRMRQIR